MAEKTDRSGPRRAFDTITFNRLAEDIGSIADAHAFAVTFESLLPQRIQRIDEAMKNQNREESVTALLSLQAAAAMVGASQLEASATLALAHVPVEMTPRGPLRRKLQGQADLFRQAFAAAHDSRTKTRAQDPPARKLA